MHRANIDALMIEVAFNTALVMSSIQQAKRFLPSISWRSVSNTVCSNTLYGIASQTCRLQFGICWALNAVHVDLPWKKLKNQGLNGGLTLSELSKSDEKTYWTQRLSQKQYDQTLGLWSVVVQLPDHMKTGHKANEAQAHNKHNSRSDFQTRGVIGIETQHITVPTPVWATSPTATSWRGPPPPQPRTSCSLRRSSRRARSGQRSTRSSAPSRRRSRRRLALRTLRHRKSPLFLHKETSNNLKLQSNTHSNPET